MRTIGVESNNMGYDAELNPEQLAAVQATEGYVRVIAGAGSGKTRALAHRFAFLVNEIGILPGNILCVTFTNKAANEMRQRIHKLTGDNDTGYVCTFHSFCVTILHEDSHAVNYPQSFMVLDNSDINDILKIIYEERQLSLRDMTFENARDMIEIRKLYKEPQYYRDMIRMDLDTLKQKYAEASTPADIIFYGYLYQEKKCFALDYNDLIKFSLYIFEQVPELRLKWQSRLEYIMIDEFQDIDEPQYELMRVLSGYHNNLFIVGDPDQTIYTWRGAKVEYLLNFDQAFPKVRTIMMMRNYRSTPEIVAVANDLIDKNTQRIKKNLVAVSKSGTKVSYLQGASAADEADWIAAKVAELNKCSVPYRDMAILYRASYLSRNLEESLLKRKIPYTIYSGVQFFERKEIKDSLCYLRMIVYKDDLSFARIVNEPKRKIGVSRLKFLKEYAEQHSCSLYAALGDNVDDQIFKGTQAKAFIGLIEKYAESYANRNVSEVFAEILNESGYETALRTEGNQERLDNLAELKQTIYEYEASCGEECTLEMFLGQVATMTNSDVAPVADKVKLMTIHAAKGLEFPQVFFCGLNEGVIPSKKTRTMEAMEEERRLAFVAITRAEKALYLSSADGWSLEGAPHYPSRFVIELNPDLIEHVRPRDERYFAEARSYIAQADRLLQSEQKADSLSVGTKVRHSIFGEGEIVAVDNDKRAHVVQFAKFATPRTISFKAKLEVVGN